MISSRLKTEEQIHNYETYNNSQEENYEQAIQERSRMIYMLPLVSVIVAITKFLQGTIFFRLATKASINFHRSLATTIIDASMEFFHIHYVGNILNRFSEDLLYIDEIVPYSMYLFLNVRFYVFIVLNNFDLGICRSYWNRSLCGNRQ
jgi:ATP-binding cassette subfamily C (CFTR/MRP) protein 4